MWTARLHGAPGGVTHRAAYIGGKIYSFNSSRDTGSPAVGNYVDVFMLDLALLRWDMVRTQLPDGAPIDISSHTVVAHGPCAYLWAGPHSCPSRNNLYRFDTNTMTWCRPEVSGEVPAALYGNSACMVGQRMYTFGVRGNSQDARFLDLDTMEWHCVPTSGLAPGTDSFYIASAIGKRIYVWADNLADPFFANRVVCDNSLYYLDTSTSTWVRPLVRGFPPVGRRGHSAFVYNEELYIFGGYSSLLHTYLADIHKYNPVTSCWTEVKTCGISPSPRYWHGCLEMGERVIIFGGLDPLPGGAVETEAGLSDGHILHLAPTLQNLCILAIIDARLHLCRLPQLITEKMEAFTSPSWQSMG